MAWRYSVLVVANVTGSSPELIGALKERAAEGACRFTLLVPATGGGSEGRSAARERLEEGLDRMRSAGLEVEGMVGHPDPTVAVSDVWHPSRFDEAIVSTLPTGASKWLAIDLPHRVEKMTGVTVRHVIAQPRQPEVRTDPAPKSERYGLLAPFAALIPGGRRRRDTRTSS
jgi:hypothetical protein